MNHPKFLKNQIWLEIKTSLHQLPVIVIFLTPLLQFEIRGYAKLYDTTADGPGWWYNFLQIPLYLVLSDFCSYWIHRSSHFPRVYNHFLFKHKIHHRLIIPTPYGSNAVHSIDGISHVYIIFWCSFYLFKDASKRCFEQKAMFCSSSNWLFKNQNQNKSSHFNLNNSFFLFLVRS